MCVRQLLRTNRTKRRTTNNKRPSPRKNQSSFFHTLNSTFVVLVSHASLFLLSYLIRERESGRGQPERREHHALTRIIGNTKGRVDRDSLYIYVIIVPDNNNNNNNNNTINTINTNEDDYEMMLRV